MGTCRSPCQASDVQPCKHKHMLQAEGEGPNDAEDWEHREDRADDDLEMGDEGSDADVQPGSPAGSPRCASLHVHYMQALFVCMLPCVCSHKQMPSLHNFFVATRAAPDSHLAQCSPQISYSSNKHVLIAEYRPAGKSRLQAAYKIASVSSCSCKSAVA